MSGRVLVTSVLCVGLAGCLTDKISMSSEVGGGSSSIVTARANNAGGSGFGGSDGGSGLGVTGDGGVLDNVAGMDPIGGYIEDALGEGNPISAILGSDSGSGLIPSAAAALAGDPDAEVTGLGILGDGGLAWDLAGTDLVGGSIDTSGVLGASIAGGNDGLLGSLLNGRVASPPLAPVAGPVASALPSSAIGDALAQAPSLGVTGEGGLVADLIGVDLVGNLVGQNTPLGGGNAGQLGSLVPTEEAPLGYVGELTTGVLNIVAGSQNSPVPGSALAPAVPVLENILGTGAGVVGGVAAPVTGALGGAPVVGDVIGGQQAGSSPPGGGALAPVTGAVGSVPVVGGVAGTVTGTLGNAPVVGGLLGGN